MSENEKVPELLVLRRMAARIGVPYSWLRDKAIAGEIPALRAGNRWMFRPDIVEPIVAAMAAPCGQTEGQDNA